ncbi:hypothetical protein SRABI76_02829 [Microbacterium oxydans]|uniref:hypothetical protein n=1 Tax=Microbacterium oxydans TaxID=82380 RepID=UPI001E16C411|nr:hypothetical protein [Microbacterium oxydans]CAH0234033.1 hypothetical protein SRABI76_02829 [Microbacterium oxydans]
MFLLTATSIVMLASTIGCSAEPRPTPTATPLFATEDEAFSAAEEVYREYLDAGNARIAGKDSPDPQDYLIGQALEADIDAVNSFGGQGIRLSGSAVMTSFSGESMETQAVTATVCIDARNVRVINTAGDDVTPAARPDESLLRISFVSVDAVLRIADSELTDAESC